MALTSRLASRHLARVRQGPPISPVLKSPHEFRPSGRLPWNEWFSPRDKARQNIEARTVRVAGEQTRAQRFTGIAAAFGLLVATVWMLATFLPALVWAVVLAIATWPLFLLARRRIGRTWAALAITALIAFAVLGPLTVAVVEAAREFRDVAQWS